MALGRALGCAYMHRGPVCAWGKSMMNYLKLEKEKSFKKIEII